MNAFHQLKFHNPNFPKKKVNLS